MGIVMKAFTIYDLRFTSRSGLRFAWVRFCAFCAFSRLWRIPSFSRLSLIALLASMVPAFPPVVSGAEPFFFLQLSDPQFGMFANDKNFVQETANHELAVATVNRLRPAFVIVTGD